MIRIEQFPELVHDYHRSTIGVVGEAGTKQVARQWFARVLRSRGYRPTCNKTWVKDGCAAVVLP